MSAGNPGDAEDAQVGGDGLAAVADGPGTTGEPGEAGALEAAESLFGDRLHLARRYAEHLTGSGAQRGLIGPREGPRLWSRHLVNCALVAPLVPHGSSVVDVGSGAGLPGLVLAIARPDLSVTLVEPLLRRTTWLDEVVDDLGLDVRMLRARAEECGVQGDVVTARAVAPLEKLMSLCVPLVRPGGQVLALKGASADEELARAEPALSRRGLSGEVVTADRGDETSFVVRVRVPGGRGGKPRRTG